MKTHLEIIFPNQLLDGINRLNRFGGDGIQPQRFGERKNLAGLRFVAGNADHAVVDCCDSGCGELVFDLLNRFGRSVVVPLDAGFLRAKPLVGVELDNLAAALQNAGSEWRYELTGALPTLRKQ